MKKIIKALAITGCSTLLTMQAMAATDGTLGATSQGDLNITVTLQDLVQITRLNDIAFGNYTGTGALAGSDAFCVYRNGTGLYQATLTGSGAGSAFELANGTGGVIAYTVTYDDGGGAAAVTSGTPLTGQNGDAANLDCDPVGAGADNTTVNVNIAEAELQGAPTGAYTGTLTILIAPE